jgi:hypothetical protein
MVPVELLQQAYGKIHRPENCYVKDILDPHRAPRKVYHDDQAPLAIVNRKGEPQRALPTLMSYAKSYAFKDNGPGLIWDATLEEMVEPNADERERAMGFQTGTTHVHDISEFQRRALIGQAMNLNCLTWIMSLIVAEQQRLAASLIGYMDMYEVCRPEEAPRTSGTPGSMVGGEHAMTAHPWNFWENANIVEPMEHIVRGRKNTTLQTQFGK